MAAVESVTTVPEEDQKEKMCPSEENGVLNETSAPVDFSELTSSQFGISIQSFTPAPSSTRKDKTRLAQIKARRRSTVGVRGSPETNSLIRFIAQQRMKTPPQTPELVRSSPFFPRVASTLRQKMASFQNLMDVVESDACDPMPVQDGNTGGCIMTRDYLSDEISCSEGKENNPPTTPTPCKKRRLGPPEGCNVEIREVDAPAPLCSLKEQEDAVGRHQSPDRPDSGGPAAASPPPHVSIVPPLLELKPSEDDFTGTSAVKKKKQVRFGGPLSPEFFDKNLPPNTPLLKGGTPARAVTPGGSLQLRSLLKTPQKSDSNEPQYQPEAFSPTGFGASPSLSIPRKHRRLSKGGDDEDGKIVFPAMEEFDSAMTSESEFAPHVQLFGLNMTSRDEPRSEVLTEFDATSSHSSHMDECKSVSEEDQSEADYKSPTPARSSNRRRKSEQESKSEPGACSCNRKRKQRDKSEPVKRSMRSAAKSACGKMKKAFSGARRWDKDVDRSLYGSREYASKNPGLSPIRERLSFSSQMPAAQQTPAPNQETLIAPDVANNTAANYFVVTKAMEEDSFPTYTSGKDGRRLRPAVRRGQRKVSVVSEESQDQAEGKTEQLFELQSSSSLDVSAGTPSQPSDAPQIDVVTQELDAQIPAAASCADSGTTEDQTSPPAPSAKTPGKTKLKQKRGKQGRRSSTLQEPQKYPEEQQTSCDVEENGPGEQTESQQEERSNSDSQEEASDAPHRNVNTEELDAQIPATASCTDTGTADPTSPPAPSAKTPRKTKLQQRRGKRGRRSSALQEPQRYPEEDQEENRTRQQAESLHQNKSSSDCQEEAWGSCVDLAPWQADFNIEDVFKAASRRGQGSVRRSLRNQHADGPSGLAWLPHTSPESIKEARRKTRQRRLSAALPVPPPLPEETEDAPLNQPRLTADN